jgi:3-oxoisoapionate decarboxylase
MKLGVDTYSLRWQGWDAFQLLDYAASQRLDNVHFSERRFLGSFSDDFLLAIKTKAADLGISVEIGMMSFDKYSHYFDPSLGSGEQQLVDMARAAKVVGSPVVRCLLGDAADRGGSTPIEQHIDECIRTLKAAAPVARDLDIKFAVENHGGVDLLARELRAIIEEVGPDVMGACLDTGNPVYGGENPIVSAEVLGPYVISSHVRDSRVWSVEDGAMVQWVPMGQGNVDLASIVKILAATAPAAPIDLEIITCHGPRRISYLDPDSNFWKLYPDMLARDFARFVALAQAGRTEPLEQVLMPPGARDLPAGALGDVLKAQQQRHFEESVEYSREVLGLGER